MQYDQWSIERVYQSVGSDTSQYEVFYRSIRVVKVQPVMLQASHYRIYFRNNSSTVIDKNTLVKVGV